MNLLTLAGSVRYAAAAPRTRRVEVDGVQIPFAALETLSRSKTGRLQDQADVETLHRLRQLRRRQEGGT